MLEIVTGMPAWVIVLLVSTTFYCISFCFEKEVSIKLLLLIPGCFMIFSIISILQQGNILVSGLVWLLGCILGGIVAKRIFSPQAYSLGRKEGTVTVPGTYSIITIFLLYFPLRYYIGYRQAIAIDHTLSAPMILLLAVSSGGIVGFFTLRSYVIFWRYKKLNIKRIA
ncbi:hypothetical protein [Dickeya solani]|uniref:DUF1453 domain-containing protein n=1 Tax=Dickeya solani TaxID=1089444 RepID=A0ABU4EN14_9GAMM|nr:hypothetical protein [Dickeya solani]MCA6999547.1 hypothetical protein [Dickeya solani]MCZ0823836.1 hypothetical protein [Dickeya solani]MDV6993759.1 hypothetical protein [Dickeya solani]MDV7005115.1 hypothetical protein [Dickeya solani]MDV7038932.1 hypothetical protein [Dickeya solani]